MLRKPVLALTSDRTRMAQTNDYCGNPEDWFDSQPFRERNLYAASFDFFGDWEAGKVCDEVWIKRISDSDAIHKQSEKELLKLISDCDGREKSNRLYRFLKDQRMIEKYMLFRDVPECQWANGQEKVVELDLSNYGNGSVSQFDANEIQQKIRQLRRRPAPIGSAGLIYSTSSLEGYLSRQPYFWPGDADTVLFDENNDVAAIIEFKKHTARSQIPFGEQRITNYLNQDILKYRSLALLRDKFQTRLFVLYYPIPRNIDYIIIEELDGKAELDLDGKAQLYASKRHKLKLPDCRKDDGIRTFANAFVADIL